MTNNKLYITLILAISTMFAAQGCNPQRTGNPSLSDQPVRDVILQAYGKNYHGYIDHRLHTITVGGIQYGSDVTDITFVCPDETEILPAPTSLLGKLPDRQLFTLNRGNSKVDYQLILTDYKGTKRGDIPDEDSPWRLVWSDDFDGDQIDWTTWSKTPRNTPDWCNTMSDADELYQLKDGVLKLRGIKNNDSTDPSPYLTGGIWTMQKKNFKLGKVAVRAKFSSGQGFWPAIWMMGKEGKWPDRGEIDIMEHLNHDPILYHTIHTDYTYTKGNKTNPPSHSTSRINLDEFNVYSVEVVDGEVIIRVNDIATLRYPKVTPAVAGQFPFDEQEFYLILSAQLGGNWVGSVDPSQLPVELEIDWVRYYEPKEQ